MTRALVATVAALLLSAAPAQAEIFVTTHDDVVASDGLCSLREAVAAATDCGTGTIHLPGGAPYPLTVELVMPGGGPPVRIEAGGAVLRVQGTHRAIVVGTNRTVYLTGLTIRGGTATGPTFAGGGIVNLGNLTLDRVVVTGNTGAAAPKGTDGGATGGAGSPGGDGGGIYNVTGATLTLQSSTVSGNRAGAGGAGGVGDPSGPAHPSGGNGGAGGRGGSGGGIFNTGTLTVTDSTIAGNAAGAGGAGAAGGSGEAAGGHGGSGGFGGDGGDGGGIGGVGTVTIVRSTIAGNRAGRGGDGASAGDGGGGGTVNKDGGAGGNGGSGGDGGLGGGISSTFAATTLTNATIAGNHAGAGGNAGTGGSSGAPTLPGGAVGLAGHGGEGGDGGSGGGLRVGTAPTVTASMTHATIAGNAIGAFGAGAAGGSGDPGPSGVVNGDPGSAGVAAALLVEGATVSARNSVFRANACRGDIDDLGGNVGTPGTDCVGMMADPRLGPLASNGGPTQTIALLPGSPAIDLIATNCATTDQRSVRRPVGGRCDAGAFEYVPKPQGGGGKPSLGSPSAKLKGKRLRLTYRVSGPGKLVVRLFMKGHKRIGRATVRPAMAGKVTLRIKLARRALRALRAKGRLRITATAVFTPAGGSPITKSKRVTVRKR
jgi:CSLREA domain-containing protein